MIGVSIALLSAALLALQIVLMQALGYAQGHHLAYVVLSVAMLGFGAGGSLLTLLRRMRTRGLSPAPLYGPCLVLCALTTVLLPALTRPLLAGLEVNLLHTDRTQWLRLTGLGGAMLFPFLFGAAALSVAFTTHAREIGRLYAANLAGSAAGACGALVLLHLALPEQVIPWLGLVPVLALIPMVRSRGAGVASAAVTGLVVLLAAVLPTRLPRSPYRGLSYSLQLPGVERTGPLPHPLGRVDVTTAPAQRYAPDLSLQYSGPVPSPPRVFIDGEAAARLLDPTAPGGLILDHTPRALPFATGSVGSVLCLDPGGSPYLNLAASHGARVTAVEPHPRIAALVRPLIRHAPVVLHRADPRLYLAGPAADEGYDLIVFPERGMFGGPVGLQALGEDTLLTVEAVETALARLGPGGRLAFQVWLDAPLRHAPRVIDLVAQALRRRGADDPGTHVLAVRGWNSLSLTAGSEPVSRDALDRAKAFSQAHGFDLVWPPVPGLERFHSTPGEPLDRLLAALLGPHPETVYANYRFDVRAPTDNRPFFNQFLRLGQRGPDLDLLSVSERGTVFLQALLLLLAVGVAMLLLLPLAPLRTSLRHAPFTLVYFAGLGAGFMCLEVALIQRLTLLWGSPVMSAALVITTLLCGMGAGSALSHRLPSSQRVLLLVTLAIGLLQILLLPGLELAVPQLLGLSVVPRIASGLAVLVVVGLPLGIPFPLGIRLLERSGAGSHIPWACGIDSALAVLTAPAAALLAFHAGFPSLAYAAAGAYIVAAAAALILSPRGNA
jgi:hypothetical protein